MKDHALSIVASSILFLRGSKLNGFQVNTTANEVSRARKSNEAKKVKYVEINFYEFLTFSSQIKNM